MNAKIFSSCCSCCTSARKMASPTWPLAPNNAIFLKIIIQTEKEINDIVLSQRKHFSERDGYIWAWLMP